MAAALAAAWLWLAIVPAAQAEGDCSMEDCQEFKEWNVGRTSFANGRTVYVAETQAYYSDQAEYNLAFVFTPGKCEVPLPYLRYPAHAGRATYQAMFAGRFRINAAEHYDFNGRLFFPEGRSGTGVFDSVKPSLFHFVEAVKNGLTLNSMSSHNGGREVLHEYRLEGSREALTEAQRRCAAAPLETIQANAEIQSHGLPAFQPNAQASAPIDATAVPSPNVPAMPVSRQCSDLSFLDNPLIAREFDHLNRRLKSALGTDLETLGIPYEVVCQDLMDGFSADGIAEALIEKYLPQQALQTEPTQLEQAEPVLSHVVATDPGKPEPVNMEPRHLQESAYQPRWYDEQPRNVSPYYQPPQYPQQPH